MAVVRARSSPPYGLFAAVALAIIATGAAVVFYVMWSKSLDDHDKALARVARLATETEQQRVLPGLIGNFDEQHTAVSQLNAMIAKDKADIAKADSAITQLNSQIAAIQSSVARQTSLANSASARATALEKSLGVSQTTFNTQVAALQDAQKKLEAQVAAANKERDAAVDKANKDLNNSQGIAEEARKKLELQLEDAQSQIARLDAEIFDLRLRIKNFSQNTDVLVGEPDGRVLRVNGVSDEVYINLGKKDHIMPGMPFTCYDPRLGVRFGTDTAAMGNGSLEVLEVGPDSSICRITRTTKDRAIQANDLIANLVYHNDRNRKFRFTIFGDFDLDGDGVSTAAERDRLITLIQAWGGQVDNDVTSQTDYLVLGEKPKAPVVSDDTSAATASAPATGPAPDVAGSVDEARTKDQERYDELEIAAKRLAIPVLNQNRFLSMIGYYNTTVVRY